MQYKLSDEELDSIVEEWPKQWNVIVSEDQLLDPEDGPPMDIPKYQEVPKELEDEEKSQDETSSTNPMDLELEKHQEEERTKQKFEQGEESRTSRLFDD